MGLLDDAIREHLDLKRRSGADPAEIERAEREALGPVRREPSPMAPPELVGEHPDAVALHDEREQGSGRTTKRRGLLRRTRGDAQPARGAADGLALDALADHAPQPDEFERPVELAPIVEPPPPVEPAGETRPAAADEAPDPPRLRIESPTRPAPVAADRAGDAPPPVGASTPREPADDEKLGETAEYDVEESFTPEPPAVEPPAAAEPPAGDVLEETPEFLQDTPDHDRLWFEQRPPRDFDFDG